MDTTLVSALDPTLSWDAIAAWAMGDDAVEQWLLRDRELVWILVAGRTDGVAMPHLLDTLRSQLGEQARLVQWSRCGS